jgi:adenylyltransferase/sulfurtransferase
MRLTRPQRLNPLIDVVTHCVSLTLETLPVVFAPEVRFDAVLDCTDTPSTRYLLSDVTARLGIPLISGAAQRTDGQLVVYNLPPVHLDSTKSNDNRNPTINTTNPVSATGPCMRCIFPSVSRTGAGAERCSDVGVLGPVVGVIGVLMALETIKILTGFGTEGPSTIVYFIEPVTYLFPECQLDKPSMLLFTGLSPRPFRNIKLRPRQSQCPGCSTPMQHLPVSDLMADIAPLEDSYIQYCNMGDSRLPEDPILTGARDGEPGTRVKASVRPHFTGASP